jgi:hypothetical protein
MYNKYGIEDMNKPRIVGHKIKFFSPKDSEAFIEWIKKIKVITSYKVDGSVVTLDIKSKNIPDSALRDIIALLYRYKIDMTQLQVFLKASNKTWFHDKKIMYWHKYVFCGD